MHKSARFSMGELKAYSEGYYWGATYALRVVVEAIRRVEQNAKLQRAAARKKSPAKVEPESLAARRRRAG